MTDEERLAHFMAEMREEFPRFAIVPKRKDPLSEAIDVGLRLITLNRMTSYMTRFHTVIGDTLYVPPGWDDTPPLDKIITLRHERVHLRQRRRYSLIGMALIYLLLPLPLFFAYGRARMEWEAYTETVVATLELRGRAAAKSHALRDHILGQFTSANYGWMWPFRRQLERWYDALMRDLGL